MEGRGSMNNGFIPVVLPLTTSVEGTPVVAYRCGQKCKDRFMSISISQWSSRCCIPLRTEM